MPRAYLFRRHAIVAVLTLAVAGPPEEFTSFPATDTAAWAHLIKEANVRLD